MKKVVNLFDLLLTRLDLVCWFQILLSVFCWFGKYSQENKKRIFCPSGMEYMRLRIKRLEHLSVNPFWVYLKSCTSFMT